MLKIIYIFVFVLLVSCTPEAQEQSEAQISPAQHIGKGAEPASAPVATTSTDKEGGLIMMSYDTGNLPEEVDKPASTKIAMTYDAGDPPTDKPINDSKTRMSYDKGDPPRDVSPLKTNEKTITYE